MAGNKDEKRQEPGLDEKDFASDRSMEEKGPEECPQEQGSSGETTEEKVSADSEEVRKLEERYEKRIEELTDDLKRLQAEFHNFRKRTEDERCKLVHRSNKDLIQKLLPVLDHLELALQNTEDHEQFVQGISMVYQQFQSVLEDAGVEKIEAIDKEFDPAKHEAVSTEEGEKDNIVTQELQKGYKYHGEILRHALVRVSKKNG